MSTEEQPVLVWDTAAIAQAQATFLREVDPSLSEENAFALACGDGDLLEQEWEDLCEKLTEIMKEIGGGRWHVEVKHFGWRGLNGHGDFSADTGKRMLREVLPHTDCTFKIYKREGEIAINNAHHDSPTWKEWYYIRPVDEEDDKL